MIRKSSTAAFLQMVFSILGIVLFVTMFNTILTGFGTLWTASGISNYTGFTTVLQIGPTVLFLGGVFGGAWAYYKGYQKAISSGINGLLLVVLGAIEIILFLALFSTILTSTATIYASANATWIALQTVIGIAPTVLLLGGLYAGGATAVGGYRSRRSSAVV